MKTLLTHTATQEHISSYDQKNIHKIMFFLQSLTQNKEHIIKYTNLLDKDNISDFHKNVVSTLTKCIIYARYYLGELVRNSRGNTPDLDDDPRTIPQLLEAIEAAKNPQPFIEAAKHAFNEVQETHHPAEFSDIPNLSATGPSGEVSSQSLEDVNLPQEVKDALSHSVSKEYLPEDHSVEGLTISRFPVFFKEEDMSSQPIGNIWGFTYNTSTHDYRVGIMFKDKNEHLSVLSANGYLTIYYW